MTDLSIVSLVNGAAVRHPVSLQVFPQSVDGIRVPLTSVDMAGPRMHQIRQSKVSNT